MALCELDAYVVPCIVLLQTYNSSHLLAVTLRRSPLSLTVSKMFAPEFLPFWMRCDFVAFRRREGEHFRAFA